MANNGIKDEVAREDASGSDDEDLTVSNERNLTRQEVKQLDCEIPWREIWSQPYMVKEKYIEAASNEFSGRQTRSELTLNNVGASCALVQHTGTRTRAWATSERNAG